MAINNENLQLELVNFTLLRYAMMNSGTVCMLSNGLFGKTKSFFFGYDRVVFYDEFVFENDAAHSIKKSIFFIRKTLPFLASYHPHGLLHTGNLDTGSPFLTPHFHFILLQYPVGVPVYHLDPLFP